MARGLAAHTAEIAHDEPLTDEGVLDRVDRMVRESQSLCGQVHTKAQHNAEYDAGKHYPRDVKRYAERERIPLLVVDKIAPFIDIMVSRASEQKFRPTLNATFDEELEITDPLDKAIAKLRKISGAERAIMAAFRDMWIGGAGVVQIFTYRRNSRVTQVGYKARPIWEVIWDVSTQEQNYTDTAYRNHGKWYTREQIEQRYGKLEENWMTLMKEGGGGGGAGGKTGGWPLSIRNSYRGTSTVDELFAVHSEWVEIETYYEIDLDVSMDQMVVSLINDSRNPVAQQEAILTAVVESAKGRGFNPQITPEEPAKYPWKLTPAEFKEFQRQWDTVNDKPFRNFLKLERDQYYFADTIGRKVFKKGKIPENDWSIFFLTDVLIRQPAGYRPRCFLTGEVDRQDTQNKALSRMIEQIVSAPSGVYTKRTNMEDLQTQLHDLARPKKIKFITEPDAMKEFASPNVEAYEKVYNIADKLSSETAIDPYSAGAAPDLRRIASRVQSSQIAAQAAKHTSRFDALRIFHLQEGKNLMRKFIAHFALEDIMRLIGSKATTLPADRRAWDAILELGADVDEKLMTPQEELEQWKNVWVDQGGWLAGLPPEYIPEPRVMASMLPTGLMPPEAMTLYKQQLETLGQPPETPSPGTAPPEQAPQE